MSRKSVEAKLSIARALQYKSYNRLPYLLGFGGGAGYEAIVTPDPNRRKVGIVIAGLGLLGGVLETVKVTCASRDASAYEQVLAADELNQPQTTTENNEASQDTIFDWAEVEPSLVEP